MPIMIHLYLTPTPNGLDIKPFYGETGLARRVIDVSWVAQ